ncbi:acyltransferase family protein [Actinophytocola sp. S1-96]|uniref:Acyltransferase family protein n=1 Tax=Actinophytocola gossypii TaxID=2812003 RepID=A0ABT2JGB4_9PSEU|nr:acyltransferase family protein [Actinophytocola gossypii]
MPDKTRTAFLDIGRGLAAVLVVYTHIYNNFIVGHKDSHTPVGDAIDTTIVDPLRLNDQGIGGIAVPLFFLISGFVITPIALKLGPKRFGVNRLLRVYPLLFVVVGVSAVLLALELGPLASKPMDITFGSVLSNLSLWNFIDRPFGAWVGVAWTLAVEVLFYVMVVALLPLLRTRLWLAISVQLWIVAMLLITYRAFGDEYRALVINMTYTLIPIMGQAMWAAWSRRIPAWLAGVFVTVAWLLFVWAGHLEIDPNYIPRVFPVGLALLVFLIGLFAEPHLRQRRFWTELSERTYSLYLVHGAVAFPVLHLVFDSLPVWLSFLVALVATALAAELSYRFVERPSHNLARRLSRRREKVREPEPDDRADEDDDDDYEDDYDDYDDEDYEDDYAEDEPAEEPTEKTPPVAPPPRRRPPPRPVPVEVETEKIQPVERPRRRPPGPPARRPPVPPRRPVEDRRPNGTPAPQRAPNGTPVPPRGRAEDRKPNNSPAGLRPWPVEDERPERNGRPVNGKPTNGTPIGTPNGTPVRNGQAHRWPGADDAQQPPRNGHRHDLGSSSPRNGRRRAEDILNGTIRDGSGGRRRAPEPAPADATRFVPARGAARRAAPPAPDGKNRPTWPGEGDDPDSGRRTPGRHRSD